MNERETSVAEVMLIKFSSNSSEKKWKSMNGEMLKNGLEREKVEKKEKCKENEK